MSKLSVDDLDPMHAALAAHFNDILQNGEKVQWVDKETGGVRERREPPSAATLNQIRQFLKDNGVQATATSKRLTNLVAGLPFAGDDEDDNDQPTGATH